jgi:hypothetical protein
MGIIAAADTEAVQHVNSIANTPNAKLEVRFVVSIIALSKYEVVHYCSSLGYLINPLRWTLGRGSLSFFPFWSTAGRLA